MKIKITQQAKVIMKNDASNHAYFGWPTAKRLQNGKIAVAASGYRLSHICPFGKTVISYSEDNGKTYTSPAPVVDTVLDDRDGGLCTFGESGVIVTSFNNRRELQKRFLKGHVDTKRSETAQQYILSYLDTISDEDEEKAIGSNFRISNDCGVTFGELYKSPITSPHGPIELADGTILWVGSTFGASSSDDEHIEAYIINTDGSMKKIGEIEDIYEDGKRKRSCEPYAIQLKNGRIVCHIRKEPEFSMYQSVSDDNGRTWSKPVRILEDHEGAPSYMTEHSSGVLIAAYSHRSEPFGIKIMFSTDSGDTWSESYYIYEDKVSADLGYPTMVELEDGSLLTVFYAHERENGPGVVMQTVWSFEK